MRCWNIEWTQRMDGETRRFTDAVMAETAALALAKWGRKSYCNAKVDAVYDVEKIYVHRAEDGAGQNRERAGDGAGQNREGK